MYQWFYQDYLKEEVMCESLGGLAIPLLTISDPESEDKAKKMILVSGRAHPGESCGSHMMRGFLEFICSSCEKAQELRKQVIFKVVPMLNPDGVVVGNFRTSLCGRDLNRQFRASADFLIPEVRGLKQLVLSVKSEFKSRFIFFLDFHGHSIKKNVFLYGPEYDIWENNYYRTRIFPKLLGSHTEMFRYYSCLFRIADFKRTTARAVILNNVPHCYTIEASTGFYYSQQEKKDIPFTPASWRLMGRIIGEALKDYMNLMYDEEMTRLERRQKLNELKANKIKRKQKVEKSQSKTGTFQTRAFSLSAPQRQMHYKIEETVLGDHQFSRLSQKARQLIEELKQDEALAKVKEQGHESDEFSEGGSDSEGSCEDIPDEELNSLHQQIMNSIKEFRMSFFNKNERQERQHLFEPPRQKRREEDRERLREEVKLRPSRESKGIEMIASLRKKAEQMRKMEESKLNWPKTKEEIKLFTATMSRDNTAINSQNKMKLCFKTSLENIEKDRKYLRAKNSRLFQVCGERKELGL
jgi:hypothetical protein